MSYPTGAQYDIRFDDHEATVTELGAGLRRYTVGGRDVIRSYPVEAAVSGGAGQQLIPWPNRIRDGRYTFAGVEQQLWLSEPKRHNASHGLARYVPWTLLEHLDTLVRLRLTIFPQPGWPGTLEATLTYQLSGDGLEVTLDARNVGATAVPFGYGAHPYFTVGEDVVDDISVTMPAGRYLEVDDERLLPVALHPVEDTPWHLRAGDPVGERRLDTAYTDLERDADGRWKARVSHGERWAELWADASFRWSQVFTGEKYRDIGIAMEPMTCGPNAFNPGPTQDGLVTLAPGETFSAQWGVRGG